MLRKLILLIFFFVLLSNNCSYSQDASRLGLKLAYSEGNYLSNHDLPKFNIITIGILHQKRFTKYTQFHLGINYGILNLKNESKKVKPARILSLRLGLRKMIYKDLIFVNSGFDFDYDIKKIGYNEYLTTNGLGAFFGLEFDFHLGEYYVLNITSDLKYGSIIDFRSNIETSLWTSEKEMSVLVLFTPQILFAYKFF